MGKLRLALPDISPAVLALALQEVSWETDQAEQLIQLFLSARGQQLSELQKVLPMRLLQVTGGAQAVVATVLYVLAVQSLRQGGDRDGAAASPSASASEDGSDDEQRQKKRKSRKEKSKSKKRKHDKADKVRAYYL